MSISQIGLKSVVETFRQRMLEREKSPVEVAAGTELAVSTVTRLLNGETEQPRWNTLEHIALFLGLDVRQVMDKAYGRSGDVVWAETWRDAEKDLVGIYRKLSEEGQTYLMSVAESFLQKQVDGGQ